LKIQVKVKATSTEKVPITFHELSEGEQQLLMVLGLMRFTKSHQSLVLLDEPDTHLNPHWSVDYLKLLTSVMNEETETAEQQTSQILISTHDPLVIASLIKDQIHLLKRNSESLLCYSEIATEDPRGLGFTGILLSDMFGFRSDLDPETLALLDRQFLLAGKEGHLSDDERSELEQLNAQINGLGFKSISSDPYYRAFIEGLAREKNIQDSLQAPHQSLKDRENIRKSVDKILTQLADKHGLIP